MENPQKEKKVKAQRGTNTEGQGGRVKDVVSRVTILIEAYYHQDSGLTRRQGERVTDRGKDVQEE